MMSDTNNNPDADFVQIIEEADDLVQVLGYNPTENDSDIEVTSFEIDGDDSIIINIEDDDQGNTILDSPVSIADDMDSILNDDGSSDILDSYEIE